MVDIAYFVKSTPLRPFTESFQHFVTDMKKFDAEKIFFDKLIGFLT